MLVAADRPDAVAAAAQVAGVSIASVILFGFAVSSWRSPSGGEPTLLFVGLVEQLIPFGVGERLHLQDAAREFAEGTDACRCRACGCRSAGLDGDHVVVLGWQRVGGHAWRSASH